MFVKSTTLSAKLIMTKGYKPVGLAIVTYTNSPAEGTP